jgi:Dolichyl-phosphate-mannose-protein mannosyltransferase
MDTRSEGKVGSPLKVSGDTTVSSTRAYAAARFNVVVVSRVILALAFAAGSYLRLWQINAMGYNTDEAVYAGQAAAISGIPVLKDIFPVFRAHPLLVQFVLSLIYRIYFSDLVGRLFAVAVGLGTVYLTYLVGKTLYGRLPGALAASALALMPYHVIVSRQLLLDGPMVFFATLTLYMLARFGKSQKPAWLYASGVAMGLTFLSKETGIILMGAIFVFLALSPAVRLRIRDLIIAATLVILVSAPFPLSILLSGGSSTGHNYLTWQLFRRPNHPWTFYLQTLPSALGIVLILIAIVGLVFLWRERTWREVLLLAWIIVPLAFFQIWPVKGYQYLLPIAPAVTLLAGRLIGKLVNNVQRDQLPGRPPAYLSVPPFLSWLVVGGLLFSLGSASWQQVQPETSSLFLAGTGGVPGGREAGAWIVQNVPANATFMTIGPSMANIIEFYGQRKAYGLSVSPNPLHRNPSYEPILNPDRQIRNSEVQYIVWDSFSAARSSFFSDNLVSYIKKYNGRVVHIESITISDGHGNMVVKPVIIIYEVHP